jgi:hypothetical protein
MTATVKAIADVSELRKELNDIPRARLKFAKAVVEILAANNLSVTGDLLGRLTLASCDELSGSEDEVMGVWTN